MWRVLMFFGLSLYGAAAWPYQSGISGYSIQGCSSCHASSGGSYTASLSGNVSVVAGSTSSYRFRINDTGPDDDYGGFDLSATGGTLQSAGTDTLIMSGEVTHSNRKALSNNQVEWIFNWTAPAASGVYTLQGAGLTSNYEQRQCQQHTSCTQYNKTVFATLNVTVNSPPLADAGVDLTAIEGTAGVQLDGSASADPGGSISSYAWQQIAGTSVTLSNAATATPGFTAPGVGAAGEVLTFRLTVTDNLGASAQDTVNVTITYNTPPVADAGSGQSVLQGTASVQLSGAASGDADGSITGYAWQQTAGTSVTLSSSSAVSPTFTAPGTAGLLTFRLTVTDNGGKTAQATVNVTVYAPGNVPPVANAGPDQSVTEGAAGIQLNGSASADTDGSISSYAWQQTGGGAVTLSNAAAASPTFTAPDVGSAGDILTFRLTVTDNGGASAEDTVNIAVTDPLPVVNTGNDLFASEAAQLTLAATASDAGAPLSSYAWQQLSGPAVAFSASNVLNPVVTLPAVTADGDAELQLTVTDSAGQTQSDRLIIHIANINTAPAAVISDSSGEAPDSLLAGSYATLYGSYSTDADGVIAAYSWVQTAGTSVCNPDPCVFSNSNLAFIVPAVPGEVLGFELTVTDSEGATGTVSLAVTVADSVQVATGGGDLDYRIGTVADGTQILEVTSRMVEPVSTASNNGPVDLPYGVTELVIDLSAAQAENGNAVYIRLSLDRNETADENLYLNSASGWTNLSDGLDFNNLVYTESGWYLPIDSAEFVAPGVLEIYVSDGGPLDTDGEVNGSITFTSGLGTTFQNGTSGAVAWHGLLLFFIWLAVARVRAWRHGG